MGFQTRGGWTSKPGLPDGRGMDGQGKPLTGGTVGGRSGSGGGVSGLPSAGARKPMAR